MEKGELEVAELEPGLRVGHRLGEGLRQHVVEGSAIPRPPRLQELIHGDRRAHLSVALDASRQRLPVLPGTRSDHQSRLQQGQRVDGLRGVQRDLEGNAAAVGMPHDMRPLDAQVTQQRQAVGSLPDDTGGTRGAAAAMYPRRW